MEISSSSLFSRGVPVSTIAYGLSMRFSARAAMVFQFLDPLRLIDDDQFGRPCGDQIEVGFQLLVIVILQKSSWA